MYQPHRNLYSGTFLGITHERYKPSEYSSTITERVINEHGIVETKLLSNKQSTSRYSDFSVRDFQIDNLAFTGNLDTLHHTMLRDADVTTSLDNAERVLDAYESINTNTNQ